MKPLALALAFASALASQTVASVTLRVTGEIESARTSARNFGRMPHGYRAADWTVTSESTAPVKISLARILQELRPGPGVAILSGVSANSVVEDAQGSNPLNSITRVGTGIVGGFATCEGLKICPQAGSWNQVILGAEVATLVMQYVFPTLQTHALRSITSMMPAEIQLDPLGTVSGMVILELAKKTPDPPPLDITITIAYPPAAK